MAPDIPKPFHRPSEKPSFRVYHLKDGVENPSHFEDFDLVAIINVNNVEEAQAIVCCSSWETAPGVKLLTDVDREIRQSQAGDVIGIPQNDGIVKFARICHAEHEPILQPIDLDESPREVATHGNRLKVDAEKIRLKPGVPNHMGQPQRTHSKKKTKKFRL